MTRDLEGLVRGPIAIAAVLAVAVALVWALVSRGVTRFIVPPPDDVGQSFFSSLSAHNYPAARQDLSPALQRMVTSDDLRDITIRLEQSQRGIEQAHGMRSQVQGSSATAEVLVTLEGGRQHSVTVAFTQEHGLWYITSLAPLEALLGTS